MKVIAPIEVPAYLEEGLARDMFRLMKSLLFDKVNQVIQKDDKPVKANDDNDLRIAISSEQVYYAEGAIQGSLNAKISKYLIGVGAVYRCGKFIIPKEKLALSVRDAIAKKATESSGMHWGVLQAIEDASRTEVLADEIIPMFTPIVKNVTRQVSAVFPIDPARNFVYIQKHLLDYAHDVFDSIKNFTASQSEQLRGLVEENIRKGGRPRELTNIIAERYQVTKNRAVFLAKQNTNAFSAKYATDRYIANGVSSFVWSSSGDSRVRDEHRRLNGNVFYYKDLPVIDERTGQRGLPGEAFGCRCKQKPIIKH